MDFPKLTENDRRALSRKLRRLDREANFVRASMEPIRDLLHPYEAKLIHIEARRFKALEAFGGDERGRCDTCSRLLLPGDRGLFPWADETGIGYCEEHAPTWGEWLAEMKEQIALGDPDDEELRENAKAFRRRYRQHIKEGGAPTDKFTEVL